AIAEATEVIFRIADTGPGIATADLPHIFDRYWQAAGHRRHGLGLGLALAKGIVLAHGGRIWAESEPGRGATFLFALPRGRS
ncbi:MAG: ATP-binding protein, partial [Polyangiaceae bacterium]